MTTINLQTFKGKSFLDVYVFIMQKNEICYKLVIPRRKHVLQQDIHFVNSMEFGCAAYAAHHLSNVSTDFSYTVPSPYKIKPFEFCIETTEPEKFVNVVCMLLGVYNPHFTIVNEKNFHFEASQYYTQAYEKSSMEMPAYGLIAIAYKQLMLFQHILISN